MNVLEIKNNLVKISYNAEDNLALSGFVIIEDTNNPYVAQVMNIKAEGSQNFAIVKLLFTFNEDGILKNYNGTIPSLKASVSSLPAKELLDIIPADDPLMLGNIAQQDTPLKVDKNILENNLLICSNSISNTSELLNNITKQINKKVIIIDTEGMLETDNKIILGKDFKIPLNYESIDYIYENDLSDVDNINRAIIQDILIEVQKYINTLPEKFLPFESFINVIDSQYKATKIPELILLKNKLLKYKDANLFAQNLKEILDLSINIENSDFTIIDISEISDDLQKEMIRYIYSVLETINEKLYVFAKVNSSNITKKLLKLFINKDKNIYTTVICPHDFKYIEEIKEVSQNVIFFTPSTLTHDFASYNTYLNKLNPEEFIVYGAHTQNIPFIVELNDSTEPVEQTSDTSESSLTEETTDNISESEQEEPEPQNPEAEELDFSSTTEEPEVIEDEIQEDNIEDEPLEIVEDVQTIEDEPIEEQTFEEEPIEEEEENYEEQEYIENTEPEINETQYDEDSYDETIETEEAESPIAETDNEPQYEVLETAVSNEESDDTVFAEANNNEIIEEVETEPLNREEMEEQIAKDVDKAFYEKLPSDDEETEPNNEDLTEDDLNIIDDLASDEIALAGDAEPTPPEEIEEKPPVVPIYPADDIEEKDGLYFEAGDKVSTAKYGEGIVEKMIKYGNKMLCSIDFPNIGRRLLDPAMTEITRIQ